MKKFSIIIPFKGSIDTLPRLFSSIPVDKNIEIILIENTDNPRSKEDIGIDREYILLNASEKLHAGGARNIGIEASTGKWLIFADSDDFFTDNAFKVFNKYVDSPYDLIYFGCNSIYVPSLAPAQRHIIYDNLVKDFVNGRISDKKIKADHDVPVAKMIRKELIIDNNIRYSESVVSEDVIFAITCGLKSYLMTSDSSCTYMITDHNNSITKLWNMETIAARINATIDRNKLLKIHNLNKYRLSVFATYYRMLKSHPRHALLIFKSMFIQRINLCNDFNNILNEIHRRLKPT